MSALRAYVGSVRIGFAETFVYRWAVVIDMFAEVVLLLAFYFLWRAVFAAAPHQELQGLTFADFFAYLLIARFVATMTTTSGWGFFYGPVRSGDILLDLSRPLSLGGVTFCRHLGNKLAQLLLVAPAFLLAALLLGVFAGMTLYPGLFVLSVLIAFSAAFCFELLVSISVFYTLAQQGIHETKALAVTLLSGALFPLALLPAPLADVLGLLPFAHFVHTPSQVLLGNVSSGALWSALAVQLAWTLALGSLSVLALHRVRLHYDLQGG